jgi:hypothetical protein
MKARPVFWLALFALSIFLFGLESWERTTTLRTLRAERKCLRYRDPVFGETHIEVRNSDGTYEYIGIMCLSTATVKYWSFKTECRKAKGMR